MMMMMPLKNHWNFKTESYLTQQQALETIENKTN